MPNAKCAGEITGEHVPGQVSHAESRDVLSRHSSTPGLLHIA